MPTIPQDLAALLAGLAAIISYWLQDDGLPSWQNAAIAGVAFLALSAICMWLIGGFTGNARDMANYFILVSGGLAVTQLSSLIKWLKVSPSPLAPKVTSVRPMVREQPPQQG